MSLILDFATNDDAERIAEIHMAAFASNVMLLVQFPTPAVRAGLQRSIKTKALADIADPKTSVLVVRDSRLPDEHYQADTSRSPWPSTSRVIGFAKWAHPIDQFEAYVEPPWEWPEGSDWHMLDKWSIRTEEAQAKAMGETACYRESQRYLMKSRLRV